MLFDDNKSTTSFNYKIIIIIILFILCITVLIFWIITKNNIPTKLPTTLPNPIIGKWTSFRPSFYGRGGINNNPLGRLVNLSDKNKKSIINVIIIFNDNTSFTQNIHYDDNSIETYNGYYSYNVLTKIGTMDNKNKLS